MSSSNADGVKLVLVGDSGVGKSCVIARFAQGEFEKGKESTIFAAFTSKRVSVGRKSIDLIIWDTAGSERYRSFSNMYFRGAQAVVVMYDVTDSASFGNLQDWLDELKKNGVTDVVTAIAGNKCDVPDAQRFISPEEGRKFADEHGFLFFETSALTGAGVNELFQSVSAELISRMDSHPKGTGSTSQTGDPSTELTIKLTGSQSKGKKKHRC